MLCFCSTYEKKESSGRYILLAHLHIGHRGAPAGAARMGCSPDTLVKGEIMYTATVSSDAKEMPGASC